MGGGGISGPPSPQGCTSRGQREATKKSTLCLLPAR